MQTLMLLLTLLFWGAAPIFDKAALKDGGPFLGTVLRGISVGVIMLVIVTASGRTKELVHMPGRTVLFFLISGMLAGALGVFTYFKALSLGPTSKIVPLASTYPLVTMILSVVLLGETVSPARILGAFFIVAGILLVK
jgi:transporter family protein